ncbi:MAG: hypothetical protein IK096_01700 [Lachnospiraceae bacterium]|nr:hypothetical protein [Lachnospiraceae bacterium]
MKGEKKNGFRALIFPLVWEVIYVVSCLAILLRNDKRHYGVTLYFMCVFYLGIMIWYRKELSLKRFLKNFADTRGFILPVFCAAVGIAFAHAFMKFLCGGIFAGSVKMVYPLAYGNSILQTLLFAITVMVLKPIASELFYRKGMIRFSGSGLMILTAVLGCVLEAVAVSAAPLGLLEAVLLALPLVITYCVTRNIYVVIFVHLIFSIIVNMPDVIYDFMRLALA